MIKQLKRRLGRAARETDEELLQDLLNNAERYVKVYTGRRTLPVGLLDGVIIELAAVAFHHRGIEGESSHSQGGVSMAVEGLPAHLRTVLNCCRVGRIGGP